MTTLEGKEMLKTQLKKVDCMEALHKQFIDKAKGFKFRDGNVVIAVDKDALTIQRQRQVRGKTIKEDPQKIAWTRFYGKKDYVGYMDQLMDSLVMKGRETVRTSALRWSEQMFGAALTLQLLYSEVQGAPELAPKFVQKAAADFEPSRKWAKRIFPEIDVGEVVE